MRGGAPRASARFGERPLRHAPPRIRTVQRPSWRSRTASASPDAAFVDADITFHAAVVAAAHNPVLADLFSEFTPVLREGLIELLALTALRDDDPNTADEAHAALVRAVADGDAEGAAEILRAELEDPFAG